MITSEQRGALQALRQVNPVLYVDSVWSPAPFHAEGLHRTVEQSILAGIGTAQRTPGESPLGIVIEGQKGAGKTHLMGWIRRQVQYADGYFFLVMLMRGVDFWESTALALVQGLNRTHERGATQLTVFLRRLASKANLSNQLTRAVSGEAPMTPDDLTAFVKAVLLLDRGIGLACENTLRALALYASQDLEQIKAATDYLSSLPEFQSGDRARWGIRAVTKSPQIVVQETSWLLALTGSSVFAIDQIDHLLEESTVAPGGRTGGSGDAREAARIGGGLMALRDTTRGSLTIVSCLPTSWYQISHVAADSVKDRFRDLKKLGRIHDSAVARELVTKRFANVYEGIGFTPPHPLWPLSPSVFDTLPDCTPRWLLMRIDKHVAACLRDDEVRELGRLHGDDDVVAEPATLGPQPSTDDLTRLDAKFAELKQHADFGTALTEATEDTAMPDLLSAGLRAWIAERGDTRRRWRQDSIEGLRPALHARLIHTIDEEREIEEHWAFRAVGRHDPRAALSRMRGARAAAGAQQGVSGRVLILLRNVGWSGGQKTQQELAELRGAGGLDLPITEGDLRTFAALKQMFDNNEPGLDGWLLAQQPATKSELFNSVLATEPDESALLAEEAEIPAWPSDDDDQDRVPESTAITLGTAADESSVTVELEALRKHMVIFAGSGSGKTVLIRRLVEECALRGVSSIVLDPNSDLPRLGDPWPSPPEAWGLHDAAKASEYHANVDVVVWTPGSSANPLSFPPLPDFALVRDNEDDFRKAVDVAVDTLAPKAKVDGRTPKAERGRAVLREALRAYGQECSRSLSGLIRMLADLPDGVSTMSNAERLAAEVAENLRAAQVNDPLFGDAAESVNVGVLLTPKPGARARVSVLSFVGLSTEQQKQAFVGRLEMELFAWLRAHPAGDRPLGGLLVIDEAQTIAPAGAATPSTQSTVLLAAQARKFGLGLVLATQAPKGLHNQISGNAGTMVIGRIGVPAQITAVEEMARARGSAVQNVGRLGSGQFYVAVEGLGFRRVRSPLCLSHHPRSPLVPDEVLRRARGQLSASDRR